MSDNRIQHLFEELVRVSIGQQEELSKTPTADEWKVLFEESTKQAIAGICFAGVKKLQKHSQSPPTPLFYEWLAMASRIQWRNEVMNDRCVEIQDRLGSDGFRSCILKGQGVAFCYYGELAPLRQSGDIDIWVDGNFEDVALYVAQQGYEIDVNEHHIEYPCFDDAEVELHYVPSTILQRHKNARLQQWYGEQLDAQMKNKVSLAKGEISVATAEFNLVYLMLHIYYHFWGEGVGMRQLMDYYFLLKTTEEDRGKSMKVLREMGVGRFAGGLMWVMQEIFGLDASKMVCEPDAKKGQVILNEIVFTGNFGQANRRYHYASSDSHLTRFLKFCFGKLRFFSAFPKEVVMTPINSMVSFFAIRGRRKRAEKIIRQSLGIVALFVFAGMTISTTKEESFRQEEIDNQLEDAGATLDKRDWVVLTQEMVNQLDVIIERDYDLEGKTLYLPEGCTLDFKGGSINNGTLELKSNTVIRGNHTECVASYNGLSHKSMIVANNVENIKIYDLTIKGNYDEARVGAVNPWNEGRRNAQNLVFIGNSKDVHIEGLVIEGFASDNIGSAVGWEEKDRNDEGFAAVKIAYSERVSIKNCKERHSAGEGWELNFCEDVAIYGLDIKRKYGVSSLNVEGCHHFSMLNSKFETGHSTGDIVNILATDATIDHCEFKGGGVDFGNEFANRGYKRIIDEYSRNVTFYNCYFDGSLRNGSWIGEKSPSKIVDGLNVINNTFVIDASKRNDIIALYLGDNGNVGSVRFENNTVNVKGKVNEKNDYFYQIIESYSRKYSVDTLIVIGNKIRDKAFTKMKHYDEIVKKHLNGVIIASNARTLLIENNQIRSCSGISYMATVAFPRNDHEKIVVRNNELNFVCAKNIVGTSGVSERIEIAGNSLKSIKSEDVPYKGY